MTIAVISIILLFIYFSSLPKTDGKYSVFSLSIQLTTERKSETKLGISHLIKAEFPIITYTLWVASVV